MKHLYGITLNLLLAVTLHAQVGIGTVSPTSTLDVRGSLSAAARSFTAATTIATTDHTLIFTGTTAATATLPDASTCTGRIYCIKNFSATTPAPVVTVATVSSQKIDGNSSWLLNESNETVILISDGANWEVYSSGAPNSAGSSWNEGGNGVTAIRNIGTTSNYDLPFITNNTEKMRLSSAGYLGVGTTSFSANPEALLVYQNNSTSFNVIAGKGNLNNYLQLNIQNQNSGTTASSDVVATADNGNETTNYIDMGMNSSGYAASGITGGADNAYLYSAANDFVIGNSTSGKNLIFFTGGTATTNERIRIQSGGNVGINNSSPAAVLDVAGTVKVGTAGTVLNSIIRFTNQSITDNSNIVYTATTVETVTLAGVNQYATVIVTPRTTLGAGVSIAYAYASAANTVKIALTNSSTVNVALGTVSFDITVIQ
jgi:hypothetical protein